MAEEGSNIEQNPTPPEETSPQRPERPMGRHMQQPRGDNPEQASHAHQPSPAESSSGKHESNDEQPNESMIVSPEQQQEARAQVEESVAKDNIDEALEVLMPGAKDMDIPALQQSFAEIGENTTLSTEAAESIGEQWRQQGIKQEQAKAFLDASNLDDKSKEAIVTKMEPMDPSDKVTAEAGEQMGAMAEALVQKAQSAESEALGNLQEELKDEKNPPTAARKEEISQLQKRLKEGSKKIEKWLRVPPKEWAMRFGKTIFVGIVAVLLFAILEMHIIHKAAAKK